MSRNVMIALLCIAATLSAVPQTKDVVGWPGTSWGMTVEEVQAAVPAAKRLKDKPDKGNVFALSVSKLMVAGQEYNLNFRFNAKEPLKLNMVSLAYAGNMSPAKYLEAFASLEKLLTEAYGAPSSRSETPRSSAMLKSYRGWQLKDTKVELGLQAVLNVVILTVVYEPVTTEAPLPAK
jgi:hypothetical protein